MARLRGVGHFATLAILCATAVGQPGQPRVRDDHTTARSSSSSTARSSSPGASAASASSTSFSSSSTTAAPAGFTTAVVPIYLIDIAQSLFTEYFPSTTPLALDEVKWPSTVVIGTATYGLKAKETSSHPQPSSGSNNDNDNNNSQKDDERLAIILASVIGFIAIAVAAVVFYCLRRRRQNTGSFFMRRSTPSTSSKGSRFLHVLGGNVSYNNHGAGDRTSQGSAPMAAAGTLRPDPLHHQSSITDSDDTNPFYTPMEHRSAAISHQELDGRHVETEGQEQIRPDTDPRAGGEAANRPPTPFMASMMKRPAPSAPASQNPFANPEDREADDVVSPILPSKSFERLSTQMVHYPSMSEVSEFDFAGDGRRQSNGNAAGGNGNGWQPTRERVDGRHELM